MSYYAEKIEALEAENARLKADLEMTKASSKGHSTTHLYQQMADENARLKAEVERLRKAGDAMERLIQAIYEGEFSGHCEYPELKDWNAAKQGGQP